MSVVLSLSIAQAPDFSNIKVMINPGHGGHDSDDRGMPNGFWESEGNLTKGLWLRDLLEARGCEVVMSRVLNRTEDDLPLSQIAQMANSNNVDLFISIHSNAANQSVNFPLTIFNGKSETPTIPEAKEWAIVLWEQLITNEATFWTHTSPHYIGDLTLNPSWTSGYGVLWPLAVPGIISEGSFHDYQPEVDRLLNLEYRKQEAWNMMYAMVTYFNITGLEETGNITGIVRDSFLINENYSIPNSADKYLPVNGAKVEILETGEIYNVDDLNTGFYYFDSIAPGDYKLIFSAINYYTDTVDIHIDPHQHNHLNYWFEADKSMAPQITGHTPENGGLIKCFDPVNFTFNMNMDSSSFAEAFSISPEIAGSFLWDSDYLNVSFQPDIPYDTETEYTVFVDTLAEHQWGVKLDTSLEFSFLTDNRNRYIVDTSFPAINQVDISPFLQFRLIFDAAIKNSSLIDAVSIISSSGEIIGTRGSDITTIDDKGHYYFSPAIDLSYDEDYTLQLLGSIKDEDNIPLVDTVKISFHTMPDIGEPVVLNDMESISDWVLDFGSSNHLDPASFIYLWKKAYRSGEASLFLRYTFFDESGNCIIRPVSPVSLLANSDTLGLWIWGNMSKNSVAIGFDNSSEIELGDMDFAGWNFLTLDIPEGATAIEYLKLSSNADSKLSGDILFDVLSQYGTLGVHRNFSKSSLTVFPNPLSGNSIFISGLEDAQSKYSIYSIDGKLLQSGVIDKNLQEIVINNSAKRRSTFILKIIGNSEISTHLIITDD